jgi:hypothetical protein
MASDNLSAWSNLRGLGNSAIARATILVPVVGYLLIFNASFVGWLDSSVVLHTDHAAASVQHTSPSMMCTHAWRLIAIYYGLTCTGIATALFGIRCPTPQKKYQDGIDYSLGVQEIFHNDIRWTSLSDGILATAANHQRVQMFSPDLLADLTLRADEIRTHGEAELKAGKSVRARPDNGLIISCLRLQYRLTDIERPYARVAIFALYAVGIIFIGCSALWGASEVTASILNLSMPASPFCCSR